MVEYKDSIDYILDQLHFNLDDCDENWDSYGAAAADLIVYRFTEEIINVLYTKYGIIPYDVSPLPNGGTSTIYRKYIDEYIDEIEFDINKELKIGYLIMKRENTVKRKTEYITEVNDSMLSELFQRIEKLLCVSQ